MSVTVRTIEGEDYTFDQADDFTANFDSGVLVVKKTDEKGTLLATFAVYAAGCWAVVFNDDAAKVTP